MARAVTRTASIIVLAAVVALILRLVITGDYLFYVKPSMLPALILTAVVLAVLAAFAVRDVWSADDGGGHEPGHDHGHGHGEPRAALLLVLPLVALLLIAPAPLGAFSAARVAPVPPAPADPGAFEALPAGDPVELKVVDFVRRATEGGSASLAGRNVRMTGFVTPNPAGGWWLTRMVVGCCAADAYPARIVVRDAPALPADTWVAVTGVWVEGTGSTDGLLIPQMTQSAVDEIPAPANPYER